MRKVKRVLLGALMALTAGSAFRKCLNKSAHALPEHLKRIVFLSFPGVQSLHQSVLSCRHRHVVRGALTWAAVLKQLLEKFGI
mgnify:CR=1 FL=1